MNEFELFQKALDIDDPAARRLFLKSVCEQNQEMLGRVEALLASHDGQSQFLPTLLASCESQLKAQTELKDFSLIPQTKSRPAGWWKGVATVMMALPLLALGWSTFNRPAATHTGTENTAPNLKLKPEMGGQPNAIPESDGWVQLFNGKDLTGWKLFPGHSGDWKVRDGILQGSTRQSHLFSQRDDYANFHLRAEAKVNLGGDGGIMFRTPFKLAQGRPGNFGIPNCYEVELHENRSVSRRTGSLSRTLGDAAPLPIGLVSDDSLAQPDEWFTIEIIAVDNHFITKINGLEVVNCSDPLSKHTTGQLALQVWNANTLVQFRKIEIKELPPSNSPIKELPKRRFASDEWIDVIPLIDPREDRLDLPQVTGKNAWRIEKGELAIYGDGFPSKLFLPLDSDWPGLECEIDFTRRAGESGFILNLPTQIGECHLVIDLPGTVGGVLLGPKKTGVALKEGKQIVTARRATLRVNIRRQQDADQVSVAIDDIQVGKWSGDRNSISDPSNEVFLHHRRLSLWIFPGGNEYVFHRIRVRTLDGGSVETLRPVLSTASAPAAPPESPQVQE